jgi:nucleoside 2-deoxyribosyltransferase
MNRHGKYYLAHPFDARHRVRKWELATEDKHGITLVNPFYDAPERDDIKRIDTANDPDELRYKQLIPSEIVRKDVFQIQQCNGTVAIVDGSLSYGTIMEMVYTSMIYHKPVYLICTNGHHQHPWLQHHSAHVFESFEEFDKWLETL